MALAFKGIEDSQVEHKIALDGFEVEILREVRRVSSPVKVVLFGSRARGDYDEESDYDVLVVLSDEVDLKQERMKLKSAVGKLPARVQLLVKHQSECEAMKGVTVGLWRNIRDEGVVLYEDVSAKRMANNPAEMKTNQDVARTLLEKAKVDLKSALVLNEHLNEMEAIGFHCQQAVEKALKAVLAHQNVHFPRTHDLGEILKLFAANGIEVEAELNDVSKLNDFAVEMRYESVEFEVDAKTALELATRAVAFAEALLTKGL
ncbi:MAG: HEPN domain-containing protein [Chloroherpetonaceae bacterium]